LFLADGYDARAGVDALRLHFGKEAHRRVRVVEDEVLEVLVVAHGSVAAIFLEDP